MSSLRSRVTYANVMSTIAVFVVLGGTATAASIITGKQIKNSSITSTDIKNGTLLAKDFKKGQLKRGKTGKTGAAGKNGTNGKSGTNGTNGRNGLNGLQGSPGVVASASAADEISDIAGVAAGATDPGWVFAGPTVRLTITAAERVIASFTGALGTTQAGGANVETDICYRSTATGSAIVEASDSNYTILKIAQNTRVTATNHVIVQPGAGTFDVGLCADNPATDTTASTTLDDNDYAQGWAVVTR